jgi:sphinganine-1-phosphate aldolase
LKPDLEEMRRQIDENTVMIVGSAPDYAFGKFDNLEEIGRIAEEFNIGCHSDCCLGSYINPFTEEAGFKLPYLFDFRVKGVTSISCDPHKYGCGPKGLSVLMFRTKELRRYVFFSTSIWTGGLYATPAMAGSRSGAIIAGNWAATMRIGKEGYLK